MVAPGPARARIRQGAHRRRSRARDAAQARKGWHSGGPEHLGGNPGRRGQAQARTRDRAAARRRPMTRRDATLGWIRVWGRAARLALAVAVAGVLPARDTRPPPPRPRRPRYLLAPPGSVSFPHVRGPCRLAEI